MKRILCLIDFLGAGGAQRQLVGLATFLKDKGYDVTVACYQESGFYVDQLLSKGVSYVFLDKATRSSFRIWHVARFIRKIKPDVVISYLGTPSICACVAHLFNHRFQLLVSERNTTQHTGLNERLRFNLFRTADYVIPNAYAQEDYINKVFPFLSNKVVTIPNFVDLQYFSPPLKRQRRHVPEIIIVSTIRDSKNTLTLIDAVAQLKTDGAHFHISWYGKEDFHIEYINQCQHKMDQLGVSDCIELKDKTSAIHEKYQEADYFCLPSFYEGTPNVICEAMASGLPVACSDVCDNSRYVVEGVNGSLFDPHDPTTIFEAIRRLLSLSNVEYENYCDNSRQRAESMLSKERFVESYIKLFDS